MDQIMNKEKIERFRIALAEESDFPMTDDLYDYIMQNGNYVEYEKGSPIVDIGDYNPDIYIVLDGIVRGYMIDKGNETNMYFGLEGTVVNSMQCFSTSNPSIIRIEACCLTKVHHIYKSTFDRMMVESNDFCRWVAGMFARRNAYAELKAKIMNGDALWRYEWLEKCRKELFEHVPLKAIASYLNMTEVHVSRIRKKIAGN